MLIVLSLRIQRNMQIFGIILTSLPSPGLHSQTQGTLWFKGPGWCTSDVTIPPWWLEAQVFRLHPRLPLTRVLQLRSGLCSSVQVSALRTSITGKEPQRVLSLIKALGFVFALV